MKRHFFHRHILNSLWVKFFVCYTTPVLLLFFIWFIHSTTNFEKTALNNLLSYREALNNQIIAVLDDNAFNLQQQSYIIYNETENLDILFQGPLSVGYSAARTNIKKTIDNFLLATSHIDGFAMFDLEGNIIFLHDRASSYYTSYNSSNDEWYAKIMSGESLPSNIIITNLNFTGDNKLVAASGKIIYNSKSKERIGIAIAFTYLDNFVKSIQNTSMKDGEEFQFLVSDGKILYSTASEIRQFQLHEHKNSYDIVTFDGIKYIRTCLSSPVYGWDIIAYTPYAATLNMNTFLTDYSSLITIFIIILVSLIVSALLSLTVTNPLSKLMISLKKVETGNFNAKISVRGADEVARMGHAYNQMLDKIQSLIKEHYELTLAKTQSELEALQSQINPHFLFNTLNSIKSVAYVGDSKNAAQMIQALSDLMRYSLSHGKYLVSFSEEITTVKKYLYLQNCRFGNHYSVQYDIEDSVMDLEIPRLIIQPLVENSIKHGLEHITKKGILIITAKLIDNHVYIYVANNGSRIPTEKLNELNKKFSDFTTSASFSHKNIGLMNVCYRLQLHYPNDFSMEMSSGEKFTTTKLILPAKQYIYKTQNECEEMQ